jgi:hypothetical protein
VTNTGPTVLTGDLGLSPGTSITGFPPGTVNGTIHQTDAAALQAQKDLTTAYDDAAGRTSSATISADVGGQTLTPGVYTGAPSLHLTGSNAAVTLDNNTISRAACAAAPATTTTLPGGGTTGTGAGYRRGGAMSGLGLTGLGLVMLATRRRRVRSDAPR